MATGRSLRSELADKATAMRPGLRVIYMTGYADTAGGPARARHGKLITLFRAIKNGTFKDDKFVQDGEPVPGLLYPRFETTTYIDGYGMEQISKADVTVYPLPTGDEVDAHGGTSMFDVDGWFGFAHWKYFCVPVGTEHPPNLVIKRGKSKRTNKSGTREGYHYQIEPRTRMTVAAYKGALDNFARNAIARQVELAKGL